MNVIRLSLCAVLLAISASALTAPAAMATTPPTGNVDGIVRNQVDLSTMPGAIIGTQRGTKADDGGCIFKDEVRGRATGQPKVTLTRTLSIDPATCLRETASATYPADDLPAAVAAQLDVGSDGKSIESERGKVDSPVVNNWFGGSLLILEDPIGIDTNVTLSELSWSPTASNHRSYWEWLWASGWYLDGSGYNHHNNGTWAQTITAGFYENYTWNNDAFLTWSTHRVNYFLGSNIGEWAWGYEIWWGGEDHTWLTPSHVAVTP